MGIVSPAEGNATVLEGHEAMVGNGDAMGVAGQVVENLFGTAEGWLGAYSVISMVRCIRFWAEAMSRATSS